MKYMTDECCGCATESYPCRGRECSLRHTVRYECDICHEDDLDEDYIENINGQDICEWCAMKIEDQED